MQYMIKIKKYYYFRARIPKDLISHFDTKVISRSLFTTSYNIARSNTKLWLYHFEKLISVIRMASFNKQLVQTYINKFLTATLESLENERLQRDKPNNNLMDQLDIYPDMIKGYQNALSEGEYELVEPEMIDFMNDTNVKIYKNTDEYKYLARELIKARIDILAIEDKRAKGDYSLYDKFIKQNTPQTINQTQTNDLTLKTLIDDFLSEKRDSKGWNDLVYCDYKSTLYLLIENFGESITLDKITHKRLIEFRGLIQRLPKNRTKDTKYKDKTFLELIKLKIKKDDQLSVTTINKYLSKLYSLFDYAQKNGLITINPATELKLPKKTNAIDDRLPYDKQDIDKLLAIDVFNQKAQFNFNKYPERIYVPLMGLLMGMRLNEICQIYLEDIIKINNIYCVSINDEKDKRLKYPSSKRIVPIHPALISNKFLIYYHSIDRRKHQRLFPNLKFTKDKGYGNSFSKYFQRINRKHITDDPKKVFHSFRHTFIDNLKHLDISPPVISAIVGHKNNSITLDRYGKDFDPVKLLQAMRQIKYDIKLDIKTFVIMQMKET